MDPVSPPHRIPMWKLSVKPGVRYWSWYAQSNKFTQFICLQSFELLSEGWSLSRFGPEFFSILCILLLHKHVLRVKAKLKNECLLKICWKLCWFNLKFVKNSDRISFSILAKKAKVIYKGCFNLLRQFLFQVKFTINNIFPYRSTVAQMAERAPQDPKVLSSNPALDLIVIK